MQYNNGDKPTSKVDTETIKMDNELDQEMENEELGVVMMIPGLPPSLSDFTFPREMDRTTEIYFDQELCYWFLDEGEFRKTLFSSSEEGEIPEVSYIVEFKKEFFVVSPIEYSVKGRFSSIETALLEADYATIGKEPYEEIDYVKVCLLDRPANDGEIDYIEDAGLFDFLEVNADLDGSYEIEDETGEVYSYDIYELFNGFFVLDYDERSVLGKFTSFESAYTGAKEEYGDEEYEEGEE
ncbi:MAG TPA: hypothetical protein VJ863_11640 [Sphaerochaeta sp.]|nr:hypothetical protein [Sphaerochaeta sp.]